MTNMHHMKIVVKTLFVGVIVTVLLNSFKVAPTNAGMGFKTAGNINDNQLVIALNPGQTVPSSYDCTVTRFPKEDAYAASVPEKYKSTMEDLVSYLVKPAKNNMEKARLIFTWLALNISYDDDGFNSGRYSDCSPVHVFTSRKSVCQGYCELFEKMGTLAGLDIVTINGYAKG